MSATIKYKGNTIATLNSDETKTLLTSGRYCEADIVVENVQDGGTSADSMKKWTVTVGKSQNKPFLLLTDPWLAENKDNEKLKIIIQRIGNPTITEPSLVSSFAGNKAIGTNSSGDVFYGHSLAITNSAFSNTSQRNPINGTAGGYGFINVWDGGGLYWSGSSNYPVRAGDYAVSAWLDN